MPAAGFTALLAGASAVAQLLSYTPPEMLPAPLTYTELPTMVIRGEAEGEGAIRPVFPGPVEGTRIFAGKKATVADLDALPQVQANNYRQALALTPGLLFSEESSPLVSLGYRGIGEPHRMQFLQVLKDGIPIHADQFGYPEAYYTPPLDVVDRIEFLRGGAGLMYGPQPAGALNYVTYQPRRDREFSGRTQHTFGSDGLYSTYNAVDGTIGRLGYLAYYNHRQADGFRDANSDYQLDGGHFKLVLDADRDSRWLLALDAYEEGHGEPGGLTFATGPNAANYSESRDQTPKPYDRFRLRRYVPSVRYERDFSEDTQLSVTAWGGYYDRSSWRQRGGGFGQRPTGAAAQTNDIERQEFYNFGIEPRVRHDWSAWGGEHTLAGGVQYFRSHSPRTDQRGAAPDAREGVVFREAERDVNYGAAFAENRFVFGRWSITPGLRIENLAQDLEQSNFNPSTGAFINRGENDQLEVKPLVALAAARDLGRNLEAYASVAQSYRPTIFTETLIVPPNGIVAPGDIEPSDSWTYEAGVRGRPVDWFLWDSSLFLVDLDNKFGGTVTTGDVTVLRTVGRSINYGADLAVQADLLGALAAWRDGRAPRPHALELYANASLLEAEIHGGVADGNRPQYAPDFLVRTGVIWRWQDRLKLALLGTVVDDHFATDDENPARRIAAYSVWDLTLEAAVWRDTATVLAGINNVFDEDYYARIRSDGIDPAYRRNFYAGFRLSF
ncbi:MAG TPA: TonB-dependent receptor plug domain-containing protein [Verrucomicrobiota bacterium]|nr:TonB-dependent receptor plug domain-containing protein [Verrucomicrobiota bacterium]